MLEASDYNIYMKKILEFPTVRQTYEHDCGAAALQLVLAYYGIDDRVDSLMELTGTTKKDGTPISGILRVLKKNGLKVVSKKMTIIEVQRFIDKKVPVIMALQAWPLDWETVKERDWESYWDDGHYAVAIGYDKKNMYFADPADFSRMFIPFEELARRWHDIDSKNKKYIHHGVAVYGKKPMYSLRRAVHMD